MAKKVKAPIPRTTTIELCKKLNNVYTEKLDDKIIRLYFYEQVFELGQLVIAKNHYEIADNTEGYVIMLFMPWQDGATTDVIRVLFEESVGFTLCKPKELQIIEN